MHHGDDTMAIQKRTVERPTRRGLEVGGKYVLDRPLGEGGMGEVWVATHRTLRHQVALKLMVLPTGVPSAMLAEARSRFELEAQLMARLSRRTRHVVEVTDHGLQGSTGWLVMELLEGETLERRLDRGGTIPLQDIDQIVQQIALGLGVAHAEGVVHRDLKPGNVMLSRDEDGSLLVKLLDFGIAKSYAEHDRSRVRHRTRTGFVLGTPNYASPEQAIGAPDIDARCDVWALACLAYEALAGKMPFDGVSIIEVFAKIKAGLVSPITIHRPDLPSAFDELFRRAFSLRIWDRFQDAKSFAEAFGRLCRAASPTVSAPPVVAPSTRQTGITTVVRPTGRTPLLPIALVAFALVFGSLVVLFRQLAPPPAMAVQWIVPGTVTGFSPARHAPLAEQASEQAKEQYAPKSSASAPRRAPNAGPTTSSSSSSTSPVSPASKPKSSFDPGEIL